MENLKENLAKNLIKLRKSHGLTQAGLAEKLNYSDKAISKWERAESMPDVEMLYQIGEMFGVTIDWLVRDNNQVVKFKTVSKIAQHVIITLLSVLVVWVVATITYVIFQWVLEEDATWLAFIYAIPTSAIVWLVFNAIWGRKEISPLIVALLLWTIVLSVFLTLNVFNSTINRKFMIFFIAIPLQICDILWYVFIKFKNKENLFNRLFKKETNKKDDEA